MQCAGEQNVKHLDLYHFNVQNNKEIIRVIHV